MALGFMLYTFVRQREQFLKKHLLIWLILVSKGGCLCIRGSEFVYF